MDTAGTMDTTDTQDSNESSVANPPDELQKTLAELITARGSDGRDIFFSLKDTVKVFRDQATTNWDKVESELVAMARGLPGNEATQSGNAQTAISFNLIYAIIDTAMAGLLPGNPKVAGRPLNMASINAKQLLDGYMDSVFVFNKMRRQATNVLFDCMVHDYGIFKTSWDERAGMARIESRPAMRCFFDQSARDASRIGWFAEAEPVSLRELKGFIEAEVIDNAGNYNVSYDTLKAIVNGAKNYPQWLLDKDRQNGSAYAMLNLDRWVTFWRFYDKANDKYVCYVEEADVILVDRKLFGHGRIESYIPFTVVTLNTNGVNANGVADTKVVHRLQQNLDRLLTLINDIVHAQVPVVLADGAVIDEAMASTINKGRPGEYVVVPNATDTPGRERFANAFYAKPIPEVSATLLSFVGQLKDIVSYTTAVSDPARGQAVNARTATEVAYMDVNNQNRLGSRRAFLYEAFEEVADKAFLLGQTFLAKGPTVFIQSAGVIEMRPIELAVDVLRSSDVRFEMVAYNPFKENPMTVLEAMHNNAPLFFQILPPANQAALLKFILQSMGAPPEVYAGLEQGMQGPPGAAAGAAAGPDSEVPPPPMEPPAAVPAPVATGNDTLDVPNPTLPATVTPEVIQPAMNS